MTTLREAVQSVIDRWDLPLSEYAASDLFEELRAALEQPAEPVAWAVYDVKHGGSKTLHWAEQHSPHGDPEHFNAVPLYTHPPQQQAEPVALIRDGVLRWHIPREHYSRPAWTAHGTHMLYAHGIEEKP